MKDKKMTAKKLLDIIQPKHGRTSCSDEELNNGFYSNDDYTRCFRCTVLEVIKKGYLPKSHFLMANFSIDDKEAQKELKSKEDV